MKTVLVIQHLDFEDLGVFEPVLTAFDCSITYLRAGLDSLTNIDAVAPDLLIVLGGPIGVADLQKYPFLNIELDLIKLRLAAQRPILGICLGAQLIAVALGAKVESMGHQEIGFAPLQLTAAGQSSVLADLQDIPVLHWHGDQFAIPPEAEHLAASSLCPHQAFAVGRHVLALQFHLEADPELIENWLIGHACELHLADLDPCVIREDAKRYGAQLAKAGVSVFEHWLSTIQLS